MVRIPSQFYTHVYIHSLSWQGWKVKTVHNQGLKEPLELNPHKGSQIVKEP